MVALEQRSVFVRRCARGCVEYDLAVAALFALRLPLYRKTQSGRLLEDGVRRALQLIGDDFKALQFCQLYQLSVALKRPPAPCLFASHSMLLPLSPSVCAGA